MALPLPGYNALLSSTALYVLLVYLLVVRLLRYRFRDALLVKYPYKTRASLRHMTNAEATEIQRQMAGREFPFTYEKALQFALFRTYGIPSISRLLLSTKQLSSRKNAGKRYSDTEVLIQEFMGNAPDSQRTMDAIARMNYIHSLYQKKGLISNDDMIYTLALFALEPQRWIARYEWRALTDLEMCALGVFWKAQADAMNIDLSPVHACESQLHGDPRRDGLAFFWALDGWTQQYERTAMMPDLANKQTADETVALLLIDVPAAGKGVGRAAVAALMDVRLREAMMIAAPPAALQSAVGLALLARKYFVRFLMLPRPEFLRSQSIDDEPDANGRLHVKYYAAEPFYIRVNFFTRNHPVAWLKWLRGNPIPGSKAYRPEGYLIPEIGPRSVEGKGLQEQRDGVARLKTMDRAGCPFKI